MAGLVIKRFENWINSINFYLEKRIFWVYLFIVFQYCMYHVANIFIVLRGFPSVIFPLNSLYIAKNILFSGNAVNSALANTIMDIPNGSFIYPPGIYLLAKGLGNVHNIFIFLFFIQLIVPLLIFKIMRPASSIFMALCCSVLSGYYFTNVNQWSPDYVIQPIMIIALLLILMGKEGNYDIGMARIIAIGFLSGSIMVLKHNVGLFFSVVVITSLFFRFLKFSDNKTNTRGILFFFLTCFFLFGFYFCTKVLYANEMLFYVMPYVLFWMFVIYFVTKQKNISFDVLGFLKQGSVFMTTFLLIPLGIFLWFGSAIGFSKYWYSLFGMGFKYLPMWDNGIIGEMKYYVMDLKNIKALVNFFWFFLPFIVNCIVVIRLFRLILVNRNDFDQIKRFLGVASLGIMAMFMFFPLEGFHILSTKLFIFIYVLLYTVKHFYDKSKPYIILVAVILVAPVILYSIMKPFIAFKKEASFGSAKVRDAIGMPMERRVSEELDKQIALIEHTIKDKQYYVIDSNEGNLACLMGIVNNHYPQYYIGMNKGILSQEVTDEIIKSVSRLPFVVVNWDDYNAFLAKKLEDPYMLEILNYVHKNFTIVNRYSPPKEHYQSLIFVAEFVIMENKLYIP